MEVKIMLRHNEVLDLLKQGKSEKEIAQEKKVSINTVRYHKMILVSIISPLFS
jgi:DNA-binding NarL/FixJ family response regulator